MKIKERLRQAVAGGAHPHRIYMGSIPLNWIPYQKRAPPLMGGALFVVEPNQPRP